MEGLTRRYRDDIIGENGNISATKGDKIFLRTLAFVKQEPSDSNFHVWVKGNISSVSNDEVTIEELNVLGKFEAVIPAITACTVLSCMVLLCSM